MSVTTFVLSAPGRDEIRGRCRDSIEQSDIGQSATWCEHPPELSRVEHWNTVYMRMAEASSELVLLLEDDALVNRHILENVQSWRWPHDKQFGAGWLYSPGGYCAGKDVWYTGRDPEWYGTVGVLLWTKDVTALRNLTLFRMACKRYEAWDCALAWAVHAMGKKIRQHGPPLVEHQLGESLLGHTHSWSFSTTRGTFRPDWQRPARDAHRLLLTDSRLAATRR